MELTLLRLRIYRRKRLNGLSLVIFLIMLEASFRVGNPLHFLEEWDANNSWNGDSLKFNSSCFLMELQKEIEEKQEREGLYSTPNEK